VGKRLGGSAEKAKNVGQHRKGGRKPSSGTEIDKAIDAIYFWSCTAGNSAKEISSKGQRSREVGAGRGEKSQ